MHKTPLRVLILSLLVVAAVASAQQMLVKLKDGRQVIGEVTETEDRIVVTTKFGDVPYDKADVASVEPYATPETEYEKRLAEIDKSSAEARYGLARWAFDNDMLEVAQDELQASLEIDPEYERARLLLRQVTALIRQAAEREGTGEEPGDDGTGAEALAASGIKPEMLVSEEDIYRIRLEELREGDRVRVEFRDDVIDRFIERMTGRDEFRRPRAEERFRSLPRRDQVMYILDKTDRNDSAIREDILIKSDPGVMREFRGRIWPIISRSCGASKCHGGAEVRGNFKVINIAGRGDRIDYTNFLLIDGVARGSRRLIDRSRPEESLLLEYGLPPQQARYKHPVKLSPPPFRDRQDPAYQRVLDWLESLDGPEHPNYRLEYKAPWGLRMDWSGRPKLPPLPSPSTGPATTQPDTVEPFSL